MLWFIKSVAPPLEFFAFSDYYLLFLIIICFFLIIIMHIGTFITHLSFIEFWSCWLVRVLVVENPIHIVIGLPSEWPDWELDYYYYVEDFGFETEKSCNAADLASLQPESDWKKGFGHTPAISWAENVRGGTCVVFSHFCWLLTIYHCFSKWRSVRTRWWWSLKRLMDSFGP